MFASRHGLLAPFVGMHVAYFGKAWPFYSAMA